MRSRERSKRIVCHARQRRGGDEQPAVRSVEPELAARFSEDLPAALVHQAMVSAAAKNEVAKASLSAFRPVADVMRIAVLKATTREAAAAVARIARPTGLRVESSSAFAVAGLIPAAQRTFCDQSDGVRAPLLDRRVGCGIVSVPSTIDCGASAPDIRFREAVERLDRCRERPLEHGPDLRVQPASQHVHPVVVDAQRQLTAEVTLPLIRLLGHTIHAPTTR